MLCSFIEIFNANTQTANVITVRREYFCQGRNLCQCFKVVLVLPYIALVRITILIEFIHELFNATLLETLRFIGRQSDGNGEKTLCDICL